MVLLDQITMQIEVLSAYIPIELFVFLGSIIEEIIAPIPSPIVMTLAGSVTLAKGYPVTSIFVLAIFGALGKTIGAWVLYVFADKAEDLLIGRIGKYLGVTHKELESVGARLNKGWQDNVFLFVARALPIIPSAPISLAAGLIKLNKKTYLTSTFAGTYVRDIMYLYLGYAGLNNYKEISHGLEGIESIGQIALFALVFAIIVFAYYKRRKNKTKV